MDIDKKLKEYKNDKTTQIEKIHKCVKNVIKNDPYYYYNRDYAKVFLKKED